MANQLVSSSSNNESLNNVSILNPDRLSVSTDSTPSPEKILQLLQSRQRCDRDQGLGEVEALLKLSISDDGPQAQDPGLIESSSEALQNVKSMLCNTLKCCSDQNDAVMENITTEELWAIKHGCLSASLRILEKLSGEDKTSNPVEQQFALGMQEQTMRLICDEDVRVRLLAGEIMGVLCKRLGPQVYEQVREMIFGLISSELRSMQCVDGEDAMSNEDVQMDMDDSSEGHYNPPTSAHSTPKIMSVLEQVPPSNSFMGRSEGVASSFDRISVFEASPKGVRSSKLETLLKLLIHTVTSLGNKFRPYLDQESVEMILTTLQHSNRFVREAGFSLCSALLDSDCIDYDTYGPIFADKLSNGLSDLCSQTRIAAAIATRKLILNVKASERDPFYRILLPKLCLCRYYMADTKFLLYSQESWRLIVNTEGPHLVEKYIQEVINFYLEATHSENHAVREAACACIAELSRKINPVVVQPFIPQLLDALKRSFHDERWHVRDSACLGCANFIANFPEECKSEREMLLGLFYENLGFPISVVRQGAASSIASTLRTYGNEVMGGVLEKISLGLEGVTRQLPDDCSSLTSLTISPETRYSYPPGPWAQFIPYARPSQPWEFGDGCLYLIGDISSIGECQPHLSKFIPFIVKASQCRSFSQHIVFLETLCKIVPHLVKGIGKRPFKEYLALFFEPIFYSIESENPQTAAAGKLCLQQLATMYGPNILKSRIEQFDPRFVRYVEWY